MDGTRLTAEDCRRFAKSDNAIAADYRHRARRFPKGSAERKTLEDLARVYQREADKWERLAPARVFPKETRH